jgi:hypothetical protein
MAEDFEMSPPPKKPKKSAARAASKTSAVYWQAKVFLEEKPGWKSSKYSVRMQAGGVRKKVTLEATVKEDAGREALAKYLKILSEGWPSTAPAGQVVVAAKSESVTTIGGWIAITTPLLTARESTVAKYAESLRTIVAGILGLARFRKAEARMQVDGFPLSNLTTKTIQNWVDVRMAAAKEAGPTAASRASNTIRAILRNARGLFSETVRQAVQAKHPIQVEDPFYKIRMPKRSVARYTSRFDAKLLLTKAAEDLRTPPLKGIDDPLRTSRFEQWKILYLALVAGLRYNEIDKLRKHDVCGKTGRISIRAHEHFQPKAAASEGEVLVSESASQVLVEMLNHTAGEWFLLEARSRRNRSYRGALNHDLVIAWLRAYTENGIQPFKDVPKPLHELRKEAGTLVNQKHGLNEAKNFLRHGDIATTAMYYVGSKGEITTGLG